MGDFNSLKADINALSLFFTEAVYAPDMDATPETEAISIRGANRKKVVFLYRSSRELTAAESQLFSDILSKGLKLQEDDVALLRIAPRHRITFVELKAVADMEKLVLLNVDPAELDMAIPFVKYSLHAFEGCSVLQADTLAATGSDDQLKKMLWFSLREMFGIK